MNIESKHSHIKYFLLYSWIILILSQVLKNNYALIYFPVFLHFFFKQFIYFQEGFFL